MSILRIKDFVTLLERTIIAEGGNNALVAFNQGKKNKNGGDVRGEVKRLGSSSGKRGWNCNTNMENDQEEKRRKGELCGKCGKGHQGVCLKGKNACYNCGQEGHIAINCPKPKKASGCFACGALDHQIRNCPRKNALGGTGHRDANNGRILTSEPVQIGRPMARTFNMTVQDAMASRTMVAGTIATNGIIVKMLTTICDTLYWLKDGKHRIMIN